MLGAGERRNKVTFQSPSMSQNTTNGEKTATWTNAGTKWAAIQAITGREVNVAKSFSAEVTHKVTILYDANVKASWRFTYQSRTFGIDGIIDPVGDKAEMVLFCTEVKPKGS